MVPEGLWSSSEFFARIAEAYASENVEGLEREEAMGKVVYLLAKHSVTMGYFEITVIVPRGKPTCVYDLGISHTREAVFIFQPDQPWLYEVVHVHVHV